MPKTTPTRERIIKAAFELISSKGYTGASTREIARNAHVAEVTLFRHFTSKEVLFTEVLRSSSSVQIFNDLMQQLKKLPYEEALKMLLLRLFERFESHRKWVRVWCYDMEHAPENIRSEYAENLRRLFGVFTEFFRNAQTQGEMRTDLDPEHAARAIHSMAYGYFQIEDMFDDTSGLLQKQHDMITTFAEIFYRATKA